MWDFRGQRDVGDPRAMRDSEGRGPVQDPQDHGEIEEPRAEGCSCTPWVLPPHPASSRCARRCPQPPGAPCRQRCGGCRLGGDEASWGGPHPSTLRGKTPLILPAPVPTPALTAQWPRGVVCTPDGAGRIRGGPRSPSRSTVAPEPCGASPVIRGRKRGGAGSGYRHFSLISRPSGGVN